MGIFKNFLDKVTKEKPEPDPAAQKAAKKEQAKQKAERTVKAVKIIKDGMDVYSNTTKKIDRIVTDATQKTARLAEKAKPAAEKIDDAVAALGEKAKNAFTGAQEKITKATSDKGHPSTGSGIFDNLMPAIPETEATKAKKPQDKKPEL